jgi:hypothetical protein
MIKKIAYCDRHDGEHPAVTRVWIKTAGMSRILPVDVCADAYETMVGNRNGLKMLPASIGKSEPVPTLKRHISPRSGRAVGIGAMPGSDTAKLATAAQAFLKSQHHRFMLDDVAQAMHGVPLKGGTGRDYIVKLLGRVMRALVADGVVERHGSYGVFGPKGAPSPPRLTNAAEIAQAVAKTIRAHPGLRVAYLPTLLDLEPPVVKRTLKNLTRLGLVRAKGSRSASRVWPIEKKNG